MDQIRSTQECSPVISDSTQVATQTPARIHRQTMKGSTHHILGVAPSYDGARPVSRVETWMVTAP